MSLEQLVQSYGYLALVLGMFFEGETILVLAGFAAHRGFLDLPLVLLIAFAGTLATDQAYFHLGRSKGQQFLERRPAWQARAEQVRSLLTRHFLKVVLSFRFLYGLRTVTPFVLGTMDIPAGRFLFLNTLGAAVWALAFGLAGYFFGNALEYFIEDLEHYELAVFVAIALVGLALWLRHRRRK